MMRLLCLFLLSAFYSSVMAQLPEGGEKDFNEDVFSRLEKVEAGEGLVTIDQSARMANLIKTHIAMNERAGGIEGFRVQLFSGSGSAARKEALEIKGEVLSIMPDADVFMAYSAPFWRVRVGGFRHKHEALPMLEKLKDSFPACYIVKVNGIPLYEL